MYIHSTPGVQIQLSHCYHCCKRIHSVASWPHGVTVSTLDSESSDRGSNPREAFACVEDQLVCEAESVFCCVLKLLMWDWLLAQQQQTTQRTEELPTTTPSDAQQVGEVVSNNLFF